MRHHSMCENVLGTPHKFMAFRLILTISAVNLVRSVDCFCDSFAVFSSRDATNQLKSVANSRDTYSVALE